MGCFNSSGFISKLPIRHGDRVVCFIGLYNLEGRPDGLYEPDELVRPYFLPIRGKYNDYGSVENIDRTYVVSLFEKYAGVSVEDLLAAIERCRYGKTINENIKYWSPEKGEETNRKCKQYTDIIPFFENGYMQKDGGNVSPLLMMEHEDVYDELFDGKWDVGTPFHTLLDYVYALEESYYKHKPSSLDITSAIPSVNNWESIIRIPIDIIADNSKFSKEFMKLRDEHKVAHGAYFINASWYTFSFFEKLNTEERFKLYRLCPQEIAKMLDMWFFFYTCPMFFSFSQTAGIQWYDINGFTTLNKVVGKKIEEIAKKDFEEGEWDVDDMDEHEDDGPVNGGGA